MVAYSIYTISMSVCQTLLLQEFMHRGLRLPLCQISFLFGENSDQHNVLIIKGSLCQTLLLIHIFLQCVNKSASQPASETLRGGAK
jgi:hypothetical protein